MVPVVREKLLQLIAAAKEKGVFFIVDFTLRTEAEQLALFAQGRKPVDETNRLRKLAGLAPITEDQNKHCVTWEPISMHEFGCAFDVAITIDGHITWSNPPLYEKLGELGESLGLRWGGRFAVRDWGHFEYRGKPPLSVAELREGKRPTA